MCGITGIINLKGKTVDHEHLKEVNNLIAHRGPDDEGFYHHNNIGLGHRRLSILDLTEAGHQPMFFDDKYVITFNGEIYNYLEIKSELLSYGYNFKTGTDTEVILASYDFWGQKCVNYFNGMWAFAIYDKLKNILFCSRDRFGVKPFYYIKTENFFAFGSEIKQLLPFCDKICSNNDILLDYLIYGQEEHTNQTFFRNIFKLTQANNLIFNLSDNKFYENVYFDLRINQITSTNLQDTIEVTKKIFTDSIKIRLRSDVKVGTCLSGGLDSSSIAAFASKEYSNDSNKRILAIHAKSIECKTDESEFAKLVSNHCNLDLKVVEPSLEDFNELVNEVVYTQEEPFGGPSIFMQYLVMREAKKNNCPVMLDGQGGDENLFGYEGYYSFYFADLLTRLKFFKYIYTMLLLKPFKVSKKKIVRDSIILIFRNKLSLFESFYRKKKISLKVTHNRRKLNSLFKFLSFMEFQKREISVRNLPHLLRYEDKNSMRHSVETRLPFVDYRFVLHCLSIPSKLKFQGGYLKFILRKVVEPLLPSAIVWRTNKFGFEAPTDLWLNSHKDEMISEIRNSRIIPDLIELSSIDFNNKTYLWKLYNISVWEKVYNVEI